MYARFIYYWNDIWTYPTLFSGDVRRHALEGGEEDISSFWLLPFFGNLVDAMGAIRDNW